MTIKERFDEVCITLGWMVFHPWDVLILTFKSWVSTQLLVFTLSRRLASWCKNDWKAALICVMILYQMYQHLSSYNFEIKELAQRFIYWDNLARRINSSRRDLSRFTIPDGYISLVAWYFSLINVLAPFRAAVYVWHHASIASKTVDVLLVKSLKKISLEHAQVVYHKDEDTGLFRKMLVDDSNTYLIDLGREDFASLISGRVLEADMPYSTHESIPSLAGHSGVFLVPGTLQVLGRFGRIGDYIVTAKHVVESIEMIPKVLVCANGRDPLLLKIDWPIVKYGPDFIAWKPPMAVFTTLGLKTARLANRHRVSDFVKLQRYSSLGCSEAWGKTLPKMYRGEMAHAVSTRKADSGAFLLDRTGGVVGIHTGAVTVDGETFNTMIPNTILRVLFGEFKRFESTVPGDDDAVSYNSVSDYKTRGELEEYAQNNAFQANYFDVEENARYSVSQAIGKAQMRILHAEFKSSKGNPSWADIEEDEDKYEEGHTGDFRRDMDSMWAKANNKVWNKTTKQFESALPENFRRPVKVPTVPIQGSQPTSTVIAALPAVIQSPTVGPTAPESASSVTKKKKRQKKARVVPPVVDTGVQVLAQDIKAKPVNNTKFV